MTDRVAPLCSCCGDEGRITICVCVECIEALRARYRCHRPGCQNMARYDSGMCGVCDVVYNDGNGKRITGYFRKVHRPGHPDRAKTIRDL